MQTSDLRRTAAASELLGQKLSIDLDVDQFEPQHEAQEQAQELLSGMRLTTEGQITAAVREVEVYHNNNSGHYPKWLDGGKGEKKQHRKGHSAFTWFSQGKPQYAEVLPGYDHEKHGPIARITEMVGPNGEKVKWEHVFQALGITSPEQRKALKEIIDCMQDVRGEAALHFAPVEGFEPDFAPPQQSDIPEADFKLRLTAASARELQGLLRAA